jgi:hypothetical protein
MFAVAPPRPAAPFAPRVPPGATPVPDLGYTVRLGAPQTSAPPVTYPTNSSGHGNFGREWQTPAEPIARAKARRSFPLRPIVALVVVAVAVVGARGFLSRDSLPPGTSEFVAGRGVTYTSPVQDFSAKFPRTPVEQDQVVSSGGVSATMHLAQAQTDDYEIVAASMALPGRLPQDQTDSVLHDLLAQGAASQNAKVTSEQHVTHGPASGLEARATMSDGYSARFMVVTTADHIYLLGVHARTGTQKLYDALVRSLVIL